MHAQIAPSIIVRHFIDAARAKFWLKDDFKIPLPSTTLPQYLRLKEKGLRIVVAVRANYD
jgi:hypothetical protein